MPWSQRWPRDKSSTTRLSRIRRWAWRTWVKRSTVKCCINVHIAESHSQNWKIYRCTSKLMSEPSAATGAARASTSPLTFGATCAHTPEKGPTYVPGAPRALARGATCGDTCVFTQERGHTGAPTVSAASVTATRWRNTNANITTSATIARSVTRTSLWPGHCSFTW